MKYFSCNIYLVEIRPITKLLLCLFADRIFKPPILYADYLVNTQVSSKMKDIIHFMGC